MKNLFSKVTLLALCLSGMGALTFYGCQGKQQVTPDIVAGARTTTNATSEESFEGVLTQALASLDKESHVKVTLVSDGFEVTVVPGAPSTAERTLVCKGSGVSFINRVKGAVDGGGSVVIQLCSDNTPPYCAYM